MKTIEMPKESQWFPLRGNPGWTPHHDAKLVRWLAGKVTGNILEIGCNAGQVTYELAAEYPRRTVYGVDWVPERKVEDSRRTSPVGPMDPRPAWAGQGASKRGTRGSSSTEMGTMCAEQRGEMPASSGDIGGSAAGLGNVRIFNRNSRDLDYRELDRSGPVDLGFVFIDGDHSYDGVKADTEKALEYFERSGRSGMIAWHDCYEGAPGWVGVWRYLEELSAAGREVTYVRGSWVAYLEVGNNTEHTETQR